MGVTLFDDASLVLIPSGIKASKVYSVKPEDGTGDLDFTRASDATRVNSAGLIEKVRTNFIRNSSMVGAAPPNSMPTGWTGVINNAGLTREVIGTGTENGLPYIDIRYSGTASSAEVVNSLSSNTLIASTPSQTWTFSSYAKSVSGTISYSSDIIFRNSAGGSLSREGNDQNLTSTLSRTTTTATSPANTAFVQPLFAISLTIGEAYDFTVRIAAPQLEIAEAASDWIATTTAAVTVGITNNVPRLDYSGGATCPSLLLEPQRTNLAERSEQFDDAYWTKIDVTVDANTTETLSPDGTNNADKIVTSVGTASMRVRKISIGISTPTISIYAKAAGVRYLGLTFGGNVSTTATYDLLDGVITQTPTATGASALIQSVGNGWYRCILSSSVVTSFNFECNLFTSPTGNAVSTTIVGNGTDGVYLFGVQFEAGAYATSYIPTTTAAVTRLADAARTASGVTSIFNSTWTAFGEVVIPARGSTGTAAGYGLRSVYGSTASANWPFYIVHGATTSTVDFQWVVSGSVAKTANVAITYGTRFKFAATSDGTLYINGTLSSASSSLTPATPVEFGLGRLGQSDFSAGESAAHNQAVLFKTALTNAQLAELTTL